jgi:threonine/homoserine/homoserine lactone efflux protein
VTEPLLLFVLASVIVEVTPGPNMAWLAVVAAAEGRRPGYAAVAGVALGLALIGLAAAFGLAAAVGASPALYQALRWGGVAWLLWLAYDGWRDAGAPAGPVSPGIARAFRRGLVTNLLNPKAAVFYLTVVPAFVTDPARPLPEILGLTATYVAIATAIHAGIVTLAGTARPLLTDPGRSRTLRRVLSLGLAGVALWFLWTTR